MVKKVYVGGATVQLTNLISSVTSSGLSGWTMDSSYNYGTMYPDQPNGYTYITVKSDNSSATGTYPCYQLFSTISGNTSETRQILYCQAKVRGKSTNVSWPRVYLREYKNGGSTATYTSNLSAIDGLTGSELNDGNWHTMSGQFHTYNPNTGDYWSYDRATFGIDVANTAGDTMDIKDVLVVNLTEGFGRGKEPNKNWCNQNIPFFEGTAKIFDSYNSDATSVANLVKKIYVGVNNIARKVKKGYIGISGIARLFFAADPVSYYNNLTTSFSAYGSAAASVGSYAVFAGGYTGSAVVGTVNAFNETLTRSTPSALSTARLVDTGAASIGSYALFAGGYLTGSTAYSTVVNAYNTSLTRSTPTALSTGRYGVVGAAHDTYALFAGGYRTSPSSVVNAYNTSLTRSTATALSSTRQYMGGSGFLGNRVIFGGGYSDGTSSTTNVVESYNASLTKSSLTTFSTARSTPAAAANDNYIIFTGGADKNTHSLATVEGYNSSLTKVSSITNLSTTTRVHAAVGSNKYILVGGGTSEDTVNLYNETLTRTIIQPLSIPRSQLHATKVGNYFLFGPGYSSNSTYSSTAQQRVDVYSIVS